MSESYPELEIQHVPENWPEGSPARFLTIWDDECECHTLQVTVHPTGIQLDLWMGTLEDQEADSRPCAQAFLTTADLLRALGTLPDCANHLKRMMGASI